MPRDSVAHAPAVLRGSRDRRAHPAVGAAARDQGLLGHGGPAARSSPASTSRSTSCRRCSCRCRRSPRIARTIGICAIGLKPADALDASERLFLIANGFHAPYDRMIRPYPRYAELHARRAAPDTFTADDLRDLQVWHKLVVDGSRLAAARPSARGAGAEGQRASPRLDKAALRGVELELLDRVIPAYRRLRRAGRSSCRPRRSITRSCRCCATPTSTCGRIRTRRCRADSSAIRSTRASSSIARVRYHTVLFGTAPRGVWPSEGSVSDEALRLLAETGCAWMATDEDILARSLQRRPSPPTPCIARTTWATPREPLRCLFRDHGLSDLIGFVVPVLGAERRPPTFVRRVQEAGRRFDSAGGRRRADDRA